MVTTTSPEPLGMLCSSISMPAAAITELPNEMRTLAPYMELKRPPPCHLLTRSFRIEAGRWVCLPSGQTSIYIRGTRPE